MKASALFLPLLFLLAACAALATPTPTDSGVQGQALLGPLCPVVREGEDCPDRPYQAAMSVLDENGRLLLRFETGEDGAFRTSLPPGEYILRPESPEGAPYPFADQQAFSVLPGEFTPIMVSYDSGIR